MIGKSIYLIFLALMAREDIRDMSIPLTAVVIFDAAGIAIYAARRPFSAGVLFGGIAIGAVMAATSIITKSIGMGDALMFLTGGIYLGIWDCLGFMMLSFAAAGITSLILITIKKCGRKKEIPFAPFALAGYMVMLAAG